MFARRFKDNLQRFVVGGLGAAVFGLTCLSFATGPAVAVAPVQLASITQPAGVPSA